VSTTTIKHIWPGERHTCEVELSNAWGSAPVIWEHPASELRAALALAVALIRRWHGIKFGDVANEAAAWRIYAKCAPEMQPILAALGQMRAPEVDPAGAAEAAAGEARRTPSDTLQDRPDGAPTRSNAPGSTEENR
jgi:hypothetical protein